MMRTPSHRTCRRALLSGVLGMFVVFVVFVAAVALLPIALLSPPAAIAQAVPGGVDVSAATSTPAPQAVAVLRVVNGDTVDVQQADGTQERVRLIGMDTPETVDPRRSRHPVLARKQRARRWRCSGSRRWD